MHHLVTHPTAVHPPHPTPLQLPHLIPLLTFGLFNDKPAARCPPATIPHERDGWEKKNRLIVAVPLHQCICPTARPARLSLVALFCSPVSGVRLGETRPPIFFPSSTYPIKGDGLSSPRARRLPFTIRGHSLRGSRSTRLLLPKGATRRPRGLFDCSLDRMQIGEPCSPPSRLSGTREDGHVLRPLYPDCRPRGLPQTGPAAWDLPCALTEKRHGTLESTRLSDGRKSRLVHPKRMPNIHFQHPH